MKYTSTRGGMAAKPFTEILLGGLADDGGLAVPDHYPQLSKAELAAMYPSAKERRSREWRAWQDYRETCQCKLPIPNSRHMGVQHCRCGGRLRGRKNGQSPSFVSLSRV